MANESIVFELRCLACGTAIYATEPVTVDRNKVENDLKNLISYSASMCATRHKHTYATSCITETATAKPQRKRKQRRKLRK